MKLNKRLDLTLKKIRNNSKKNQKLLLQELSKKLIGLTNKEQLTLIKVKSLLNHLDYIIKPEHKKIIDEFHKLCRKYCSWGKRK